MGSYCKFCSTRCFVVRTIPDGPQEGWTGCLATCRSGMEHDRAVTGHDHTTSLNPVTGEIDRPLLDARDLTGDEWFAWLATGVDPRRVAAS